MSAELILPLCLAALAVFILWEGWERRHPRRLSRAEMANGYVPGAANLEAVWFTVAFVAAASGLVAFANPPTPPFEGRGALLLEAVYAHFGPLAFPISLGATALGAFLYGVKARRQRFRSGLDTDAS